MWRYVIASLITVICVPILFFIFLFILPMIIPHRLTKFDDVLILLGLVLLYSFLICEQGLAAIKWLNPIIDGRDGDSTDYRH